MGGVRVGAREGGVQEWESNRLLTGTQYCMHNYAPLVVTKHLPLVLPQG